MNFRVLFFLFLLLAVAVFSVQNADVVQLRFLVWNFSASQSLVIFLSALIGIAMGAVSSLRYLRKRTAPTPPKPLTPAVSSASHEPQETAGPRPDSPSGP